MLMSALILMFNQWNVGLIAPIMHNQWFSADNLYDAYRKSRDVHHMSHNALKDSRATIHVRSTP